MILSGKSKGWDVYAQGSPYTHYFVIGCNFGGQTANRGGNLRKQTVVVGWQFASVVFTHNVIL